MACTSAEVDGGGTETAGEDEVDKIEDVRFVGERRSLPPARPDDKLTSNIEIRPQC
ncbi:hypothetical protein GCM10007978_23300 [Shewanella hanedai]|nr:hypothetical protein GCM10007978_23300 [Shewanella hanedai]